MAIAGEEKIAMKGEVLEAFPSGMFRVSLDNGPELIAYTAEQDAQAPDRVGSS